MKEFLKWYFRGLALSFGLATVLLLFNVLSFALGVGL